VHRGDGDDAEVLRSDTDCPAPEAVATGGEGGTRDHNIGFDTLEVGPDGLPRLGLTLIDEVVAADDGGDDPTRITEDLLECAPRADRLAPGRHADIGLVLPADPGEELVDVVDDSHRCAHDRLFPSQSEGFGP
jgi:hypothetical protein